MRTTLRLSPSLGATRPTLPSPPTKVKPSREAQPHPQQPTDQGALHRTHTASEIKRKESTPQTVRHNKPFRPTHRQRSQNTTPPTPPRQITQPPHTNTHLTRAIGTRIRVLSGPPPIRSPSPSPSAPRALRCGLSSDQREMPGDVGGAVRNVARGDACDPGSVADMRRSSTTATVEVRRSSTTATLGSVAVVRYRPRPAGSPGEPVVCCVSARWRLLRPSAGRAAPRRSVRGGGRRSVTARRRQSPWCCSRRRRPLRWRDGPPIGS